MSQGAWLALLGPMLAASSGAALALFFLWRRERQSARAELSIDLAEKAEAERRLQQNNRELLAKNKDLQNFASVAAHDLQEPLRKIQAFGQQLEQDLAPAGVSPEALDSLKRMLSAATRMRGLIEDLLSFTRASNRENRVSRLSLDEVMAQVLGDLELSIRQNGARLQVDALPSVEADATQMRQLFQNLISNSIKYARDGTAPEISVRASLLKGGGTGDWVKIEFSDNGIGFEPEYSEKIFELFQRLHSRGEYGGTGIGLAICRRIVERHNGSIRAESAPGLGSSFIVTLPLSQALYGVSI